MKYSVDKQERYSIFTLNELSLNSIIAPDVKSEFVIFRNEGVKNLVLDLANVKFVDSSGLSAILTANRLWKGFGLFVITGVDHPAVKKLIEISRLDSVLTIIPTVEEATDYIMMDELEKELSADADSDNNMQ